MRNSSIPFFAKQSPSYGSGLKVAVALAIPAAGAWNRTSRALRHIRRLVQCSGPAVTSFMPSRNLTQVKPRCRSMGDDPELMTARVELAQFEGHFEPSTAPSAPSTRAFTPNRGAGEEAPSALCRLVLRQADTIAYLQMDLGFMLFLKTSMKPKLHGETDTTKQ